MRNCLSRGSSATGDSWKMNKRASIVCHNNWCAIKIAHQSGPVSISDKMSYRNISGSRNREIDSLDCRIHSKLDSHHHHTAVKMPVKFQGDRKKNKYKSHGFETSRDLTRRRLIKYWNGAQVSYHHYHVITNIELVLFRWSVRLWNYFHMRHCDGKG